jgi:diguanylate cyclase (GGDEF)-like protein/PAS domain S-box-containing protein
VEQELERLRDRSASVLILVALVAAGPLLIANSLDNPDPLIVGTGLIGMAILGGAWLGVRRQGSRSARLVTVVLLGILVAARSYLLGGVDSIAYEAWLVHMLIAGLLLGRRAAWISATCGAVWGLALVWMHYSGHLAIDRGPTEVWARWLLRCVVLLAATLLVGGLLTGVRAVLSRLRDSESIRRKQEQRYQLAAEGANYGTWDFEAATNLVWLGPAMRRLIGLPSGASVVSPEGWRARIHTDDRPRVLDAFDRHIADKTDAYEAEYRIRHADGSYVWVHSRGRKVVGDTLRIVGTIQDISGRKLAQRELQHRAFHDPLTGLPNRELFLDRLGRALIDGHRQGKAEFAVVFVDLDRFKVVNDSLGHAAGDQVLGLLADRLSGAVRAPDTVARLGGDEFTVLPRGPTEIEEAKIAVSRIERAVNEPFDLGEQQAVIGASIGILMGSLEYTDPEELLHDADLAMYSVKGEGAGRVGVFDPGMRRRMRALLDLDSSLRKALDDDALEPWFQPIVDLEDGRIVGVEALARWRQEDGTVLAPGAFIPRAEETGIVADIDRRIIERAAHTVAWWNENGPPLTLSVNVSARQFLRHDLLEFLDGMLERAKLPPNLLQVEITEGILLLDAPGIRRTLTALRQRGIPIAFDDFGTGYSSLSYLHQFQIQRLKIDRAFVQERGDKGPGPICRAIQSMATALGIQTIAEGVETEAQAEGLRILGCTRAQGFLYSEPKPYADGRPDQVGSTS